MKIYIFILLTSLFASVSENFLCHPPYSVQVTEHRVQRCLQSTESFRGSSSAFYQADLHLGRTGERYDWRFKNPGGKDSNWLCEMMPE